MENIELIFVKISGIFLVATGVIGISYKVVGDVRYHAYMLGEVNNLLTGIMDRIDYSRRPMEEVLWEISRTTKGVLLKCLEDMQADIDNLSQEVMYDSWRDTIERYRGELGLAPQEVDIFIGAGRSLGDIDIKRQIEFISMAKVQLEQRLALALKEQKDKERVYRSLGILGGVFLIIILL